MNNTTPIKILTAAVLLTFGFALTANAALINKGVTEMNHEYTVSDTLSARQQVIPLIAASMASSQMDKLNAALNQGLDAGLTINEAKEILIQLYAYTGFPRSLNALNELMKVVETRKQRGIEDIEGKAPIARIPVGDELRRVGTANQTKISGAPVQGPLFDFAPTINQFLQTHLFGDIFARDNLDWQSRELATVGALAATPGVEAQLLSHTRASLRVGLTAAQLRQLAQVLREHGDNDAATRADEALQNVRIALMTTIGVTERLSSWNQRTEVHDWKRRSERLVRACGHIYTIVRPGWFDYNNDDEHRIVMLQGDRRHAGTPEDGVISREQIAQVLVTALSNDAAKNKTFELVAERGEAQQDLTLLFAELRNDNPQKNDGVFDIDNMPLTEEPECVINDLNLYSKNSKI